MQNIERAVSYLDELSMHKGLHVVQTTAYLYDLLSGDEGRGRDDH